MKKRTALLLGLAVLWSVVAVVFDQAESEDTLTGRLEAVSCDTAQSTVTFSWEWDRAPAWKGGSVQDTVAYYITGLNREGQSCILKLEQEHSDYVIQYYRGDTCVGELRGQASAIHPLTFPTVQTFNGQRGWARSGSITLCVSEAVPVNNLHGTTATFCYGHPTAFHFTAPRTNGLNFGQHTNTMFHQSIVQNINGQDELFDGGLSKGNSILSVWAGLTLLAVFLGAALLPVWTMRRKAK